MTLSHHKSGSMIAEDNNNLRVVLIGDSSVGKTSILNQLINHKFHEIEPTTVGANYQLYHQVVNDSSVDIQIWDTAGQEKFRSLGPIYFRKSAGAIAVFDLTNRESFNHLDDWIRSFTDVAGSDTIICIAANKCDLAEKIEIPLADAVAWGKLRDVPVFPTSALSGEGVEKLFFELAVRLSKSKWCRKRQVAAIRDIDPEENEGSNGCGC